MQLYLHKTTVTTPNLLITTLYECMYPITACTRLCHLYFLFLFQSASPFTLLCFYMQICKFLFAVGASLSEHILSPGPFQPMKGASICRNARENDLVLSCLLFTSSDVDPLALALAHGPALPSVVKLKLSNLIMCHSPVPILSLNVLFLLTEKRKKLRITDSP